MSHRGMPARDIDKFDDASLRGLPNDSIGVAPVISLRTMLAVVVVGALAFGIGFGT